MDFTFTEEQQQIRKTVIDFARQELNCGLRDRDRASLFHRTSGGSVQK
jgi:hypothetical protein